MDGRVEAFDNLKKAIFDNYDRLQESDSFTFGCHPGVPCFNDCCSDVNIFLTPYDIVRLKNRLGMKSWEFLDKHTLLPIEESQHYPIVLLKMEENEKKSCPFVDAKSGCTVYEDRPWPCRMFPVGKASPKLDEAKPFYFLMREDVCRGFEEKTQWTVRGWIEDQKAKDWDDAGEKFKEITLHDFFNTNKLTPPQMEMFHMVAYNLDKFREFVFESSFLRRFDVDEATIEAIRAGDEALLDFGYSWIRFSLFKEPTFTLREEGKA